uniref:Uncharacterized protein n=1 Tax=Cacopsylla melanoneura TaxID=428564 RepID=A0A8D9EEL9_9HEMI
MKSNTFSFLIYFYLCIFPSEPSLFAAMFIVCFSPLSLSPSPPPFSISLASNNVPFPLHLPPFSISPQYIHKLYKFRQEYSVFDVTMSRRRAFTMFYIQEGIDKVPNLY